MAIADIAANFSNRMVSPLGGLNRGIEQGQNRALVNQQADRQNRLMDIQESNLQAESDQLAESQANKRLGVAGFAAYSADTPEEWVKAQQAVPELQSVPFEQRETFTQNALVNSIGPEKTNKILNPKAANEVNVTTNVDANKRSDALASTLGKLDANRMDAISQQADDALGAVDSLSELDSLLSGGFKTGFGAETRAGIGRALSAFGVSPEAMKAAGLDEIANAEQFMRAAADLTLKNMKFLKGAMSEKELSFLQQAAPKIGNSIEGNRKIISVMKSAAERTGLKEDMAEDHLRANGSMAGFNKKWRAYVKDNPLFDPKDFEQTTPEDNLPPGFVLVQ